ncbi:hypothetical protein RHGRI_013707 [Rhododendron griersonianum]|uniref:S-locus receptor kinase C-terminal domain-containing protein n=1 Tax=Rhododendron griersonianum TaxID=479676 RepID=A0AAV6K6K9_9ERIC|nr:hypothetical protein RHGRI_013707 [Rhododendron griersonianum]
MPGLPLSHFIARPPHLRIRLHPSFLRVRVRLHQSFLHIHLHQSSLRRILLQAILVKLQTRHLDNSSGKKGISFKVLNLIAIVVPIAVSIIGLSVVACFCFISRRAKKKLKNIREDSVWTEITSVKSLQYDLGVIQAATNNLSDENKIGGDGFGPLYKAWKLWSDEAALDLMDGTEIRPYSKDEVTRCIHVALLCVQDDPDVRPSMAIVVPMLDGYSSTLSIPQPPAFYAQSRTDIALDQARSKSIVWSVNEVSISELEPR